MSIVKILLFCCWYRFCLAEVLHLKASDFHNQIAPVEHVLVFFYTTWCIHCHKVHAHYSQAAELLRSAELPAVLATIECSKIGWKVCSQEKVFVFPHLRYYHKGKNIKEYNGGTDAGSIYSFVWAQIFPKSVELNNVDEFKRFLDRAKNAVLVGFFEQETNTKLRKLFFRVHAEKKEILAFAHSSNEKLLRKQGVVDALVMFRPNHLRSDFEDERVLFTGNPVIGEIKNFINAHYHGLVGYRNPSNVYDFANPSVILYYSVEARSKAIEPAYWRRRILRVAALYKHKMNFAVSAKLDFEGELIEVGSNYSTRAPAVIARDIENQKFLMKDHFSTEAFEKFVEDFAEGKLLMEEPHQPFREYDELVTKNNKDTLLLWCPHCCHKCHDFAHDFEEIASKLEGENVAVVKMDNRQYDADVPVFLKYKDANIFWFGNKKKKYPILYQGKWEVKDIIKFVAKMATSELRRFDRKGRTKVVKVEL